MPFALDVVSASRVEDERVVGRDRRRNGHGQRLGNGFYQQEILQSGWHIPPGFITALAHFCSLHAGVPRHVAELVHQNFGIFGRFSGFDMSGTHGIEGGSQVGRVLGPDRGPDAGAGMTEFELHGVQPLPVKSQGLR